MRTVSTAAQAIMADPRRFAWFCDLYQFTLADGSVVRWTGSDLAVAWAGHTYSPGPLIDRDKIGLQAGLETSTAVLTITPGDYMLGGMPLRAALLGGIFDSATVRVLRGIAATPGAPLADAFEMFTGRVDTTGGTGFAVRVSLVSSLYKLAQQFPRNVYSPACGNQLFDSLCGLATAPWVATAAVASLGADPLALTVSGLTGGAGFYRWGKAKFVTGANAGRVLRVKDNTSTTLTFAQPWLDTVAIGDDLVVYPGCDKTRATCASKFSNLSHFRGQPFIPAPEMAT